MVFWELPCTTVLDDGAHLSPMCPAFWFRDRCHVWVKVFGSLPLLRVAWGYSYSYSLFTFSQQNQVNVSFDLPWFAVSTISRTLTRALISKLYNLISDLPFFPVLIGQNYRGICIQIQRPSSGAGNIDPSSTVSGRISDMSLSRELLFVSLCEESSQITDWN